MYRYKVPHLKHTHAHIKPTYICVCVCVHSMCIHLTWTSAANNVRAVSPHSGALRKHAQHEYPAGHCRFIEMYVFIHEYMYVCMYVYMYVCEIRRLDNINILQVSADLSMCMYVSRCVGMLVCMCACTYVYMHACSVRMHVCTIHTRMNICVYVRVNVILVQI